MKFLQSGLTILVLSLIGLQATADTVVSTSVTTFEPGAPLQSSQMNTTLNALITAINDNAAKIAAMEAAAAAPLDVAGREYCVTDLETGFFVSGTQPNDVGVTRGSIKAALVLAAGGTATLTTFQDDFKDAFPDFSVFNSNEPLGTFQITWTLTGNVLALDFGDGDVEEFSVSKSGELIVGGIAAADTADDGSGIWYTSNITVAVEVTDAVTTCNQSLL